MKKFFLICWTMFYWRGSILGWGHSIKKWDSHGHKDTSYHKTYHNRKNPKIIRIIEVRDILEK